MAPLLTRLGLSGNHSFGFGRRSTAGPSLPWSATGGTITTPGNGYRYHTFTSTGPGSFVVASAPTGATIELLMVAGGGGGGYISPGGGAGGVIFYGSTSTPVTWGSSLPMVAGSYSLSVGAGGITHASGLYYPTPTPALIQAHGENTTFTHPSGPFTAIGGGTGSYAGTSPFFDSSPYYRGGSGGLGEGAYPGSPNPSPQRQGYPGAPPATNGGNGGGGGAGEVGQPAPTGSSGWNTISGPGGIGVQFPNFTGTLIGVPSLAPLNGYYAGGGGGCGRNDNNGGPAPQTGYGGLGGLGGGGGGVPSRGRTFPNPLGTYAGAITNSGGGGGSPGNGGPFPGSDGPQNGEPGASGILVIRYLL
jgi:hypothetical protein